MGQLRAIRKAASMAGGAIALLCLCNVPTASSQQVEAEHSWAKKSIAPIADLVLGICQKRKENPAETDPSKVRMRIKLEVSNQGTKKSTPTIVSIRFEQHSTSDDQRHLSYAIPAITNTRGLAVQGAVQYYLQQSFTPFDVVPYADLNNGLTAVVTVDPDNTVPESGGNNNATRYDLSPGNDWQTDDGSWKECPKNPIVLTVPDL